MSFDPLQVNLQGLFPCAARHPRVDRIFSSCGCARRPPPNVIGSKMGALRLQTKSVVSTALDKRIWGERNPPARAGNAAFHAHIVHSWRLWFEIVYVQYDTPGVQYTLVGTHVLGFGFRGDRHQLLRCPGLPPLEFPEWGVPRAPGFHGRSQVALPEQRAAHDKEEAEEVAAEQRQSLGGDRAD